MDITKIEWPSILASIDFFMKSKQKNYDVIIGIARGGLPIAVTLSHRMPEALFSVILTGRTTEFDKPYSVFNSNNTANIIPSNGNTPSLFIDGRGTNNHVLIVDDVATFGSTLFTASQLVKQHKNSATIDYFVYAADIIRVKEENPNIYDRLCCYRVIDNRKEWLSFPWENL
jgi:hypoxanthine phosphoribosyltransferase